MTEKVRLLADMNISPKTVKSLQQGGWDVIRVPEVLPPKASDRQILELARRLDRAVVTQDLDFSALLALGGHSRPSLVTVRLSMSNPETVTRRLLDVLPRIEHDLLDGRAVTVSDLSVRIRKLPII